MAVLGHIHTRYWLIALGHAHAQPSSRPAKRQSEPIAARKRMIAFLDREYPMVAQSCRTSPCHDIPMPQRDAYRLICTPLSTPQKNGGKTEGNGYDGRIKIQFAPVLVQ